ncbi:type II secretion system ATPase GspE [Neiella sp. HB171785]|uniref:Type II secretion system protein E n=1 Tax=Neiella litorisoli TaxID=2771431 RepID=A0A8J6UMT4_9GAMM|nr:type II secretion system ATPase GspE [Neiella litorisoli]MBD1391110.1 type II secretion system ATPase GspE [Neiella litorisoli]
MSNTQQNASVEQDALADAELVSNDQLADTADERAPEHQAPTQLPFAFAREFGVLLILDDGDPRLCHKSSAQWRYISEARRVADQPVRLEMVADDQFELALTEEYQRDSNEAKQLMEDIGNDADFYTLAEELPETEDLLDSDDDAPIIKLINAMLGEAIKYGASDVHVETYEQSLVIRFRVDGVLREMLKPNRKLASLLVSRIKVMARLDIAEKRVPQDGRISLRIAGRAVDVRVSTMPSSHGERVVLRLLDKNQARLDLQSLGMTAKVRDQFAEAIAKPHGIILVTGPTGSGKSTTLYAALTEINSRERNILTVEDPIEYAIEGIGQTQVNNKVDMTFARGLRAILRQDPDVVMVGEIRDLETAQIAVQASLTGHLVLSTLHTNTAVGAITRLHDMGVEPFLLSSSLLGVLAQRLVRTLCDECRDPYSPSDAERELMHLSPNEPATLYHAKGCEACNYTGYKGRTGIHELLVVTDEVREMIHNGENEQRIERLAREHSSSIRSDGFQKVLNGETTLEEVMRVTREE